MISPLAPRSAGWRCSQPGGLMNFSFKHHAMISIYNSRTFRILCTVISVIFVLLAIAKCLQNAPNNFDIALYDESNYLLNGLQRAFTPNAPYEDYLGKGIGRPIPLFAAYEENGLYSSIYTVLSAFISDPVDLHLYGANIIIFVWLIAVFFCTAFVARSFVYGSLIVGIFLLSPAVTTTPRVSLAAITVMAIGLAAAVTVQRPSSRFAILTLCAFLCCFIRAEFVLPFYIFAICTLATLLYENRHSLRKRKLSVDAPVWLSFGMVLLLSLVWSFPLFTQSQRAFAAFAHGVAIHVARITHSPLNPWTNWESLFALVFPGATSISEAARMQPGIFVAFIESNVLRTSFLVYSSYIAPFTSGAGITTASGVSRLVLVFAAASFVVMTALAIRRRFTNRSAIPERFNWVTIFGVLCLLAPVVLACLFVWPLDHYLVLIVFLFLSLLALVIRRIKVQDNPPALLLMSLAVFLSAPVLPVDPQPTAKVIRTLQQSAPRMHAMLEIDGGWCVYLSPRCETYYAHWLPAGKGLQQQIDDLGIDSIMVSQGLMSYAPVANDPYFLQLRQAAFWNGWTPIRIGDFGVLLVRSKLLNR